MASVGLAIATLQPESEQTLNQQVTLRPQANATPAQGPSQHQDIVTLTGRTGESQEGRTGDGSAQFGEAATFFFAESQTFRAANGSGGNQTAKASNVPQLPVKTMEEPNIGETQEAKNERQGPAAAPTASALAVSIGSSSTSSTASSSDTPLAELAQLDATLQQMDINPQSISLFNRMEMLLYANDPAALRELVQTLQQGTQQIGTNRSNAGSGTSPVSAQSLGTSLLPGQVQDQQEFGSQLLSESIGGQSQPSPAQVEFVAQAKANLGQAAIASNSEVGTNVSMPSASAEAQNVAPTSQSDVRASSSAQLGELLSIFAVVASTGFGMEDPFGSAGHTLDVTV